MRSQQTDASLDGEIETMNDSQTQPPNFQRRQCRQCGEDLGFSEADPCAKCESAKWETPNRIYVHPTNAEWQPSRAPHAPEEYIEYVRADLPRAVADIEQAARLADGFARRLRSINNHATAAGVEVLAKEIRELAPHVETGLTVEAALKDANELCRSALSIAKREGIQTNWAAFASQLEHSLRIQHKAMKQIRTWAKSRAEREGERT
jgi:hypothetical protein